MKLEQQIVANSYEYKVIHKWLARFHGKANHCEGSSCKGISKRFHWAKLPECKYEAKRENFIQLCASCHKSMDMTEEEKAKISSTKKGVPQPTEHRLAISRAKKGTIFSEEHKKALSVAAKKRYGTI